MYVDFRQFGVKLGVKSTALQHSVLFILCLPANDTVS
jgi:hypothetical protein